MVVLSVGRTVTGNRPLSSLRTRLSLYGRTPDERGSCGDPMSTARFQPVWKTAGREVMATKQIRADELEVGHVLWTWEGGTLLGPVERVERFDNGCVAVQWTNPAGEQKVILHGPGQTVCVQAASREERLEACLDVIEEQGARVAWMQAPDNWVRRVRREFDVERSR